MVVYGGTTGYGSSAATGRSAFAHSVVLSDLECGTVYRYSLIWTGLLGPTRITTNQSFATDPCGLDVTDVHVSVVSDTAFVSWETNIPSDAWVLYGVDTSHGFASVSGTVLASHSVELLGLLCDRTYHFSVAAEAGGLSTSSGDRRFQTPTCVPTIEQASVVSSTVGATVTWPTDGPVIGQVMIGTEDGRWFVQRSDELVTNHKGAFDEIGCGVGFVAHISAIGAEGSTFERIDSATDACGPFHLIDTEVEASDLSVRTSWRADRASLAEITVANLDNGSEQIASSATVGFVHELKLNGLLCGTEYLVRLIGISPADGLWSQPFGVETAQC
ncbi:MAG: hypothetical protein ACI91O_000976 [Candidatus Poriferisodalaceae bacterium]